MADEISISAQDRIKDKTEKLNEALDFNITNLDQVLVKLPMLYNDYLQEWYHVSRTIDKLEIEMSNMFAELFGYYKVSYEIDLNNQEVKEMINNNIDRNKVRSKLMTAKTYADFLERSMENINNTRWAIKSLLDYENFKNGVK